MHLKALNGLNTMSFFSPLSALRTLRGNRAVFDKPSLMHLTV